MQAKNECWCGNTNFIDYSSYYHHCVQCGTLVLKMWPDLNLNEALDSGDLYSKDYYLSHLTQDYGYPSLEERSRSDLTGRSTFWLRTFLKYKLPPAKTLEMGSGPGTFVALLNKAGFDATGLELSPWLVEHVRDTFQVPMLQGAIETQPDLKAGTFDAIILMDVLEHLPDPVATMRYVLTLLKADGILVVQMPNFPEGKTFQELVDEKATFVGHFKEKEHLHLFSQRAAQMFFERLGAPYIAFEKPIFYQYDQFFIVSRQPLQTLTLAQRDDVLLKSPGGRFSLALLDLFERSEFFEQHANLRAEAIVSLQTEIAGLKQYNQNLIAQTQQGVVARLKQMFRKLFPKA